MLSANMTTSNREIFLLSPPTVMGLFEMFTQRLQINELSQSSPGTHLPADNTINTDLNYSPQLFVGKVTPVYQTSASYPHHSQPRPPRADNSIVTSSLTTQYCPVFVQPQCRGLGPAGAWRLTSSFLALVFAGVRRWLLPHVGSPTIPVSDLTTTFNIFIC